MKTYLDLVNDCDNFPYPDQGAEHTLHVSRLYRFCLQASWNAESTSQLQTVGFVLPAVAHAMPWTAKFHVDNEERTISIKYNAEGENYETAAIEEQLKKAREFGTFKILEGWRNELYPIHGVDRDVRIERSGSALFGIHTMGVHMNAYQRDSSGEMKLWIPRRAGGKSTYAGMLDNTVAGGIAAGEDQHECVLREAREEASLSEEVTREKAVPVGIISYFYIRDSSAGGETGLFQPETQYLYDIELDTAIVPKPSDDEVQEFYLWTVDRVTEALKAGEFKPNCALCLIDFLIRHGYINAKNEPDYREIISRIHRRIRF